MGENAATERGRIPGTNRMTAREQRALYFGCKREPGHFLWDGHRSTLDPRKWGLPWKIRHLDGQLLENGKVADIPTGLAYWTVGRRDYVFWHAFFWWDRSVDRRPASNSGFYVSGFEWGQHEAAFQYACEEWPDVVKRQVFPVRLRPEVGR